MPNREKSHQQPQSAEFPPRQPESNAAQERETAALRALVKILAREAARDAFEEAIARENESAIEGSER
jgi:hypothetical protein